VSWKENVSTILVSPLNSGNIGSVARALKNMGFRRLKLVEPVEHLSEPARMMAVHACDVLESAMVYPTLEAALADEVVVFGTTSFRARRLRTKVSRSDEIGPLIRAEAAHRRVGLVFGSERGGLSEDELARCQHLVTIPADESCPTLNLSHAVLALAYEISRADVSGETSAEPAVLADQESLEQMYRHIEDTLLKIGFLSRGNPGHIMRSLRRILSRSELTPRDVQILRGIMNQMDWYSNQGHLLPAEKVEKR